MRRHWYLLIAAAALGCGLLGRRAALRPQDVRRLALRPVINKTQQFGLEDALLLRTRDEFLRDGRCPLVTEPQAQDVVRITLTTYLYTPIQYDSALKPTAYKLEIRADAELLDAGKPEPPLWVGKDIDELLTFPAPTLPGGLTEAGAQSEIWDAMSRDIVDRVMEGLAGPDARVK